MSKKKKSRKSVLKTLKMVQSGEINDGESAFAILLASMSLRLRSAINSTI